MLNKRGKNMSENYITIIEITDENTNDTLHLAYDDDKLARKAFHNAVSEKGLEYVSVRKEWH
tara:strand:+ start:162 stop:347 length:186 start_codon:yes stop_codon:yes gene_type:complete